MRGPLASDAFAASVIDPKSSSGEGAVCNQCVGWEVGAAHLANRAGRLHLAVAIGLPRKSNGAAIVDDNQPKGRRELTRLCLANEIRHFGNQSVNDSLIAFGRGDPIPRLLCA